MLYAINAFNSADSYLLDVLSMQGLQEDQVRIATQGRLQQIAANMQGYIVSLAQARNSLLPV
jgi:hypothetical protein